MLPEPFGGARRVRPALTSTPLPVSGRCAATWRLVRELPQTSACRALLHAMYISSRHPAGDTIQLSGVYMRLFRRLAVPASESHLVAALVLCMVVLSLLLCGVIWQSGVIDYQRELIRLIWNSRYGG